MNQTFNLRRFRLYCTKSVLERPIMILGSFALACIITVLIYFLMKSIANFEIAQLFSFTIGFIGGGGLLASLVFAYFGDAANGASFLTLPASNFEKWLCGISILVVFILVYLLFFRGIDSLLVSQYHKGLNPLDARYRQQYDSVFILSFTGEAEALFIFFANAIAAMLVGSLYFNKVSFIKAALVICMIYVLVFVLDHMVNALVFKDYLKSFAFHSVVVKNGNEDGVVDLPAQAKNIYDITCTYILPALLLGISFIRLKEKEI